MRAISLWQPWATLMAIGAKSIETRGWATGYRGQIAIHAARRWTAELQGLLLEEPFRGALQRGGYSLRSTPAYTPLPLGAIVAIGYLQDCRPTEYFLNIFRTRPRWLPPHESAFGDYTPGRYGWFFSNIQRIDPPIPCRGHQGFWHLEDFLARRLQRRHAAALLNVQPDLSRTLPPG